MAKVIMVQGTMSSAGKSLLVAGLCRVFSQDGYKVYPFKSQNMALNSFITKEGLEIGRAQVMQAEAAGVEPEVSMNPILLKPTSDMGSQIIVNGISIGNMKAMDYYEYKSNLVPEIKVAFRTLSQKADIIVIEGAGSPAEINLKDNDIVNMGMASIVDAPVLLVGDIDRGGVFAQLLGTLMLLTDDERQRVTGLVINKFRGDKKILDPGIDMLSKRANIPVVGTIPYMNLSIDDEDSLSERLNNNQQGIINISVIKLPKLSNYSDFIIFDQIDGVCINYIDKPEDIDKADMVIIPGTKNTIADIKYLRESGMEAAVKRYSRNNIVFGICGGYQMLGRTISDPDGMEEGGSIQGMELLNVNTTLMDYKTMSQVDGMINDITGPLATLSGMKIKGYEIHMGNTISGERESFACIKPVNDGADAKVTDGAHNGNVYGTYVHGVFDDIDMATELVRILAARKGVTLENSEHMSREDFKNREYNRLADYIRNNMDMEAIYGMLRESLI